MSEEDAAILAEIVVCLNIVDKNHSFVSTNLLGDMYRYIFPDSNIAKNFHLKETKAKYIIQFGIAQYFEKELQKEYFKKTFTSKFDKSTNQQVKKQYDGYVHFWCDES